MLSRQSPAHQATPDARGRRVLTVKIAAATGVLALLAAGCSASGSSGTFKPSGSSGSSRSAGSSGSASGGEAASAVSPLTAITLAADQAKKITSFASTMSIKMSGAASGSMAGTMQVQTKPSLLASADFGTLAMAGQSLPGGMQEILTSKTMYLKMAVLQRELGKPWVQVPFSELQGAGLNLGQFTSQIQNNNPLVQTQMLAAAKNVRKVGSETVNGVATTHYTGTYPVSAGLAKLPASARATAQKQLQSLGVQTVQFDVWIDGQHQTRKLVVTERGGQEQVSVTMNVTGINQPVDVAIPSASQVATVPASALSGT